MHLILRGLSEKHGGIDIMRKDWVYVGYSILTNKDNVIDLLEVLCQVFRKFAVKRKPNEIYSPRLWALTMQQLYSERREAIPLNSDI